LVLDLLMAGAFAVFPLLRRYDDDQGDGRALVLLPAPRKTREGRAAAFIVVFIGLDLLDLSSIGRGFDNWYAQTVAQLAGTTVRAPAQIVAAMHSFNLGLRFLVVATIICLGLTMKVPLVRRLLILAQAVWFMALMLCVDATCAVLTVIFGLPLAPGSLMGQLIALVVGMVVLLRTIFANFALPKGTELKFTKRVGTHDSALMLAIATTTFILAGALAVMALRALPAPVQPSLVVMVPLLILALGLIIRTFALHVMGMAGAGDPPVGDERPLVEVIIPAYNEEEWIVSTLEAIDVAAQRYGGPVRVIMTDDGSTDATNQLATATMAGFRYASGIVVDGAHRGKSAALNTAITECTSDIVIRIDADTLIDEWCIYYSVRWFGDPTIGQVQAMVIPKKKRSIFSKMRLFECLQRFGFLARAIQVVDAVCVVPGMFTAFRRQALMDIGGFTLGMNGEDADMTLNFARLGYRTWLDPKVVIYEDVPSTYSEFRDQRIRWSRANIHTFARHAPFRVGGFSTPKTWFTQTQSMAGKLTVPVKLTSITYVLMNIFLVPADRVLAFRLLAVFGVAYVLPAAAAVYFAGRYGVTRQLLWVVLWGPFVVLRLVFGLEALLSLPPRPVRIPAISAPPATISDPVVV
jgi:glycosyltransferase involved in cell wall biosynthesis